MDRGGGGGGGAAAGMLKRLGWVRLEPATCVIPLESSTRSLEASGRCILATRCKFLSMVSCSVCPGVDGEVKKKKKERRQS